MSKKEVPLEVIAILKGLSEDELAFMSLFEGKKDFLTLLTITQRMIENNKDAVMSFQPEYEPTKLAVFKAYKRGEISGLTKLAYAFKGAEQELKRRADLAKKKKNGQ